MLCFGSAFIIIYEDDQTGGFSQESLFVRSRCSTVLSLENIFSVSVLRREAEVLQARLTNPLAARTGTPETDFHVCSSISQRLCQLESFSPCRSAPGKTSESLDGWEKHAG